MELSKRLQMNADLVRQRQRVADVGCDHGYVSIYLSKQKECSCIALDVNAGPLAIAKENIAMAGLSDQITCRLSDGLCEVEPGEVDAVLIAGMGGMLATRIVQQSREVVKTLRQLVIQAQSDLDHVRREICALGFLIDREECCYDNGKFYLAISFLPGTQKQEYKTFEWHYGRDLLERKDNTYRIFLEKERQKKMDVMEKLKSNSSDNSRKRMAELKEQLGLLEQALETYY